MRSRWIWMTVTAAMAMCLSSAEQAMAQADKQLSNSIGMKLVLIPAGTFQMGTRLTPEEVHQRYPGGGWDTTRVSRSIKSSSPNRFT